MCGWHVESPLRLPELEPWPGDDAADVVVAFGEVPASLPDASLTTALCEVSTAPAAIVRAPNVATYLVRPDRITIAPQDGSDDESAIRLFLLGTVFGLLCHMRDLLPLRGAAVEIDGKAVIIAGVSGAGKSTLAAAFGRRGYRMLADDVSPIRLSGNAAQLMPSIGRMRLWGDTLDVLGYRRDELSRSRDGIDKFDISIEHSAAPRDVRAVIHIHRFAKDGDAHFRRLRGTESIEHLMASIYRKRSLAGFAGPSIVFQRTAKMVGKVPLHLHLFRPLGFDALDRTVDVVVSTMRESQ